MTNVTFEPDIHPLMHHVKRDGRPIGKIIKFPSYGTYKIYLTSARAQHIDARSFSNLESAKTFTTQFIADMDQS